MPSPSIVSEDAIESSAERRDPARRLSVLVAEDNDINALLIRTLLTRLGHDSVMAGNGDAAICAWSSADAAGQPFDLVLMDIQMPVLDGLAATRLIRARETFGARSTPILALTANTQAADRAACLEAGMDGFLVKPLDRDKLAAALDSLTPQSAIAAA